MTIPADVHIYVRSVRGDSLTGQKGFEPACKLRKASKLETEGTVDLQRV